MPVVQLFNRERRAFDDFSEINDAHRDANVRAIFYYAVYFPAVELITALGVGLILWYGGGRVVATARVARGADRLPPVRPALLPAARRTCRRSTTSCRRRWPAPSASSACSTREVEITVAARRPIAPERGARARIELDDVSFSYKPGEPVLRDVSLPRRAGRDGGGGGPHRRRQEHPRQPAAALLRRRRGRRAGGRRRRPPNGDLDAPAAEHRHGAPGRLPLLGHHRRQHPPGRRGDRRRAPALGRRARCTRCLSSSACRPASTPSSASAAPASRWGRSSSSPSPAPSPSTPGSSSSTRRPRRSTPRPSSSSSAPWTACSSAAPAWSSPTASPPSSAPTASWSCTRASLREQGTHQELLALRGIYYRLYLLQYKDQEAALAAAGG